MFTDYLIPILAGILGLVMLCVPEHFVIVLVVALGIFLIVSGIYIIFKLSNLSDDTLYRVNIYVRGGLSILLGGLCIFLPIKMGQAIWTTLCVVLGIFAILAAVSEFLTVLKLKEQDLPIKQYVTEIIGMAVTAVVLFLLPKFGNVLLRIAGGVIILVAIVLAINIKKNEPIIADDAEVVDEDAVVTDEE